MYSNLNCWNYLAVSKMVSYSECVIQKYVKRGSCEIGRKTKKMLKADLNVKTFLQKNASLISVCSATWKTQHVSAFWVAKTKLSKCTVGCMLPQLYDVLCQSLSLAIPLNFRWMSCRSSWETPWRNNLLDRHKWTARKRNSYPIGFKTRRAHECPFLGNLSNFRGG